MLSRFIEPPRCTTQIKLEVVHVNGDNSLRWFRVVQGLNVIKGREGQQEKVVDDHMISK